MAKGERRIHPPSARSIAEARIGLFRATLLFGSAAVALSLIVVPELDRRSRSYADASDIDTMITGAVAPAVSTPKRYTVRRSVLDDATKEPCLLFPDGTQRGSC